MTKSEYQDLVEYLAGTFAGINQNFERIDQRFVRIEMTLESHLGLIQQVAEGVAMTNDGLRRLHDEMDRRFGVVDRAIASLRADMDGRFTSLRDTLDARFTASDKKLEEFRLELERRAK